MDLNYTEEELAFRDEVREFLKKELPASLSSKVLGGKRLTREDMQGWHDILNRRGWLADSWPVEYGGTGWNAVQKQIFEDESPAIAEMREVMNGRAAGIKTDLSWINRLKGLLAASESIVESKGFHGGYVIPTI